MAGHGSIATQIAATEAVVERLRLREQAQLAAVTQAARDYAETHATLRIALDRLETLKGGR